MSWPFPIDARPPWPRHACIIRATGLQSTNGCLWPSPWGRAAMSRGHARARPVGAMPGPPFRRTRQPGRQPGRQPIGPGLMRAHSGESYGPGPPGRAPQGPGMGAAPLAGNPSAVINRGRMGGRAHGAAGLGAHGARMGAGLGGGPWAGIPWAVIRGGGLIRGGRAHGGHAGPGSWAAGLMGPRGQGGQGGGRGGHEPGPWGADTMGGRLSLLSSSSS